MHALIYRPLDSSKAIKTLGLQTVDDYKKKLKPFNLCQVSEYTGGVFFCFVYFIIL